jgi:hypothetical protein
MLTSLGSGCFRGAVLGLLLAIGWNTSRQTNPLEAGHFYNHLTFGVVVGCGAGGALAGLLVAAVVDYITHVWVNNHPG